MTDDKRSGDRIFVKCDAVVISNRDESLFGMIRDLSPDGFFIETPMPLFEDRFYKVCFNLQTPEHAQKRFMIAARMVHRNLKGAGFVAEGPVSDAYIQAREALTGPGAAVPPAARRLPQGRSLSPSPA